MVQRVEQVIGAAVWKSQRPTVGERAPVAAPPAHSRPVAPSSADAVSQAPSLPLAAVPAVSSPVAAAADVGVAKSSSLHLAFLGMSAADNRLFVSTREGKLICFEGK